MSFKTKVELVNTKVSTMVFFEEFDTELFTHLEYGIEVASFGDAGDLYVKCDGDTIIMSLANTRYCYDYDSNTSIEEYIKKFVVDYNKDTETEFLLDAYYLKVKVANNKCSYEFVEVIDEELYKCLKE